VDDDCEDPVHQVRISDEGAHIRSPQPVGVKVSNLQSKAIEMAGDRLFGKWYA